VIMQLTVCNPTVWTAGFVCGSKSLSSHIKTSPQLPPPLNPTPNQFHSKLATHRLPTSEEFDKLMIQIRKSVADNPDRWQAAQEAAAAAYDSPSARPTAVA